MLTVVGSKNINMNIIITTDNTYSMQRKNYEYAYNYQVLFKDDISPRYF